MDWSFKEIKQQVIILAHHSEYTTIILVKQNTILLLSYSYKMFPRHNNKWSSQWLKNERTFNQSIDCTSYICIFVFFYLNHTLRNNKIEWERSQYNECPKLNTNVIMCYRRPHICVTSNEHSVILLHTLRPIINLNTIEMKNYLKNMKWKTIQYLNDNEINNSAYYKKKQTKDYFVSFFAFQTFPVITVLITVGFFVWQ